jgi:serine/threonine-protein kinase
MDFGIAHVASSTSTQTSVILGTPSYMSPEQVTEARVDGRSDVFSLAVVLFELLTGEKPFQAENLSALLFKIVHESHPSVRKIRPDLPESVENIVQRALQKAPSKRYQSGREFSEALRR